MIQKHKNKAEPVRQNREINDVLDLKLALLDLNKHGFDIQVSTVDSHRILVTCKRTRNRFAIECIGDNDKPTSEPFSALPPTPVF